MNSLPVPGALPDTMGVYSREPLETFFLSPPHPLPMKPNEARAPRTFAELFAFSQTNGRVEILANSGHHLYFDNTAKFLEVCAA